MKHYEINVNGQVYQVSLKEISPQEAADIRQSPAKEKTVQQVPSSDGMEIAAPMAGNILSINVKPGDSVQAGDTLLILEAMKMENEIVSPVDGVVSKVLVSSNEGVESDQLLIII